MAKLPNPADPTLAAADAALVANAKQRKPNSLGASWLGDECERRVWLKFRHCGQEVFQPITLKRFEDGHHVEDVVIARLKAVEGIELYDKGEDGKQFGFSDFGGHFKGFYDGVMLGLKQAPKAWHIFEAKAAEKWDGLEKAKIKLGEKSALMEWNYGYYVQAQLYMHYECVDRHYMVAASPGAPQWASARTEADPVFAMKTRAKAERLIFSDEAPPRVGPATDWRCRSCFLSELCHESAIPERECRSCIHAEVLREGGWRCAAGHEFGRICDAHRFLPSILNGEQIDVRDGVVHYRMNDGGEWHDDGKASG